jgi:hypothetical protein
MVERLLILALLVVAVALLIALGRVLLAARRNSLLGRVVSPTWAGAAPTRGVPTILAFSTATCAQCRRLQTPALQTLQDELGSAVEIVHVDAIERGDLASTYRILTVPATVVLTPGGRVAAFNDGFAPAALLRTQVATALSD